MGDLCGGPAAQRRDAIESRNEAYNQSGERWGITVFDNPKGAHPTGCARLCVKLHAAYQSELDPERAHFSEAHDWFLEQIAMFVGNRYSTT
jgi:hypothetical protein